MIGKLERILSYCVLAGFAMVVLLPLSMLLLTAVSPRSNGGLTLTDMQWNNFVTAWKNSDFGSHLVLSITLTTTVTIVTLLAAPLAAYAIAILKIPGHQPLFLFFLAGMMIPLEGIIVPLYYTLKVMPLSSTIWSLALAQIGLSMSFGVFWMRASFRSIPASLIESASIDGAGRFTIYSKIAWPLTTSASVTLALLTAMWVWNDYFLAFVLVNNPSQLPVTVTLGNFTTKYATQINLMSACAVLVALPVVIAYLVFQRRFIAGVLSGALKG